MERFCLRPRPLASGEGVDDKGARFQYLFRGLCNVGILSKGLLNVFFLRNFEERDSSYGLRHGF